MDITSNNDIIEMYNRKKIEAKFTLGYWLWLKGPAVNLLRTTSKIIVLVGLALPLHIIYVASEFLTKQFIKLPKSSELITLTRDSKNGGKSNNLPMNITGFNRGGMSYGR